MVNDASGRPTDIGDALFGPPAGDLGPYPDRPASRVLIRVTHGGYVHTVTKDLLPAIANSARVIQELREAYESILRTVTEAAGRVEGRSPGTRCRAVVERSTPWIGESEVLRRETCGMTVDQEGRCPNAENHVSVRVTDQGQEPPR